MPVPNCGVSFTVTGINYADKHCHVPKVTCDGASH